MHIIPDTLSQLAGTMPLPTEAELDFTTAYNYMATLVEMSEEFRAQLLEGYSHNPTYQQIIKVLDKNDAIKPENRATLPFSCNVKGLIWHNDKTAWLCILDSNNLISNILKIAHTEAGHPGAAHTYERAASSWYICRLARNIRNYLRHCPQCRVYQTCQHPPYRSLQPIQSLPVPFHTIMINFILMLPKSGEFNAVMSVTDKFSKQITLVPGRDSWTASQWAHALLECLWLADWGLPKVIISDCNRKFLSTFWTSLFEKLGIQLLYSTAYHLQTNGQSEQTNQMAKTMLQFFIGTLENDSQWPKCLTQIQLVLNNLMSTTGRSANEICYSFMPNFMIDYATTQDINSLKAWIKASNALDYVAMNIKHHYDCKHTAMFLRLETGLYYDYIVAIQFHWRLAASSTNSSPDPSGSPKELDA